MTHLHDVRDTDTHYVIDPITMEITNPNEVKNKLMLGDHDSEIYTFEIPKVIEGHDMSQCNKVEVHYINIGSNKTNRSEDVYPVGDMAISTDDPETLVFSWKVSGNATMYAGTLNFRIKFACVDDSGNYTYKKWTDVYKGITVSDGFDNGEAVVADYSDILAQWEARIAALEANACVGIEPANDDIPKVFINGVIPTTKDDVLAEMQYISKTGSFNAYLKIKCQGTSSMAYAKKNFTIKLYSDEARETKLKKTFRDWGVPSSKFVLKANYIDHSHARNIICANLWDEVVSSREDYETLPVEMRNSPRNGAIDGFPIKVYTNGTYQGIYTWNIGKDDWMFGMDEDNANHVLLCAETNTGRGNPYAEHPCNFRALWNGVNEEDWSIEVGTNSDNVKNSLNALISCVMDTDDDTFKATLGNHLDVQSAIDYYLHMYTIAGIDGLAKNMLLATFDGTKWICGAYDMDSTFGLIPQGYTGTVRPDYACPAEYEEAYSLLWERIVNCFTDELKTRYAQLRKGVYSFGNIVAKFERFMDTIGLDLFAEDATIYAIPDANKNNIQFIRNFVRDRLAYTDETIPNLRYSVPATSLALDKDSITFNDFEPVTIVATVTPSNTTDAVTWTSSDPDIATVHDGVVTPRATGKCTITVKCGYYTATCSVTVADAGLEEPLVWKTGTTVLLSTGGENASANGACTDFVNLRGATRIISFGKDRYSNEARMCFYDLNKNYLSGITHNENLSSDEKLDVPESAVYVRFNENATDTDYVTYFTDTFVNGFTNIDSTKFVAGKYPYNNDVGYVESGNENGYFDVSIPVQPGQILFALNTNRLDTGETATTVVVTYGYSSDGTLIGQLTAHERLGAGTTVVTIPDGVTSVKITGTNTTTDKVWYKVR